MDEILLGVGVFFLASIKYLFAAGFAFTYKFTEIQGFVITSLGGIAGVFFFTILSERVQKWLKNYSKKKKKKSISNWLRFMAKLRKGPGLIGVAFLTPLILSVPVGCFVAKTFVESNKKIIVYNTISVLLWGLLIFGLKYMFNINLTESL